MVLLMSWRAHFLWQKNKIIDHWEKFIEGSTKNLWHFEAVRRGKDGATCINFLVPVKPIIPHIIRIFHYIQKLLQDKKKKHFEHPLSLLILIYLWISCIILIGLFWSKDNVLGCCKNILWTACICLSKKNKSVILLWLEFTSIGTYYKNSNKLLFQNYSWTSACQTSISRTVFHGSIIWYINFI